MSRLAARKLAVRATGPSGRTARRPPSPARSIPARKSRRKFLRYYPGGFKDADYIDLERGYKWTAHERWIDTLSDTQFRVLLQRGDFAGIAQRAVAIESRTN